MFSVRDQVVSILGFVSHLVSAVTFQLSLQDESSLR